MADEANFGQGRAGSEASIRGNHLFQGRFVADDANCEVIDLHAVYDRLDIGFTKGMPPLTSFSRMTRLNCELFNYP